MDSLEICSNISYVFSWSLSGGGGNRVWLRNHCRPHCRYVGVGRPTEPEDEDDAAGIRAADGPTDAGANGGGAASSAGEGSGRVDRGKYLSVAECNPVRAWAYLLGALPKVHTYLLTYMKMLAWRKE